MNKQRRLERGDTLFNLSVPCRLNVSHNLLKIASAAVGLFIVSPFRLNSSKLGTQSVKLFYDVLPSAFNRLDHIVERDLSGRTG